MVDGVGGDYTANATAIELKKQEMLAVADSVGHLLHNDNRVVPECESSFEVVNLVVHILLQAPILQDGFDGVPSGLFERFESLTSHHSTDILETHTRRDEPYATYIRLTTTGGSTPQD